MSLFPPKIETGVNPATGQVKHLIKRPVIRRPEMVTDENGLSMPKELADVQAVQAKIQAEQMKEQQGTQKTQEQAPTAPQSQNERQDVYIAPVEKLFRFKSLAEQKAEISAQLAEADKKPDAIPMERLGKMNEVNFSDVYITPDKKCYTWAAKSNAGLKVVTFEDYPEFLRQIEAAYDGRNRSYLLTYEGRHYRVERTIAGDGFQYCARKMPVTVPDLKTLGLPQGLYKYLLSLAGRSGLILLAGPTGSGKSTTISALLQEYLSQKGGYCFTIEDPIELPLDGVYVTPSGELGLCKQTTPPDGIWQEGIKSALRSKPRYIYLGEIRDPDVASESLRAATSGHLVLSTIHANNVSDAINSLVKYAASSGISEEMAYELVANGFLGCLHQILEGAPKHISVTSIFANPDLSAGCQVRSMFRQGKLNLATVMEQQKIKLDKGVPLF